MIIGKLRVSWTKDEINHAQVRSIFAIGFIGKNKRCEAWDTIDALDSQSLLHLMEIISHGGFPDLLPTIREQIESHYNKIIRE